MGGFDIYFHTYLIINKGMLLDGASLIHICGISRTVGHCRIIITQESNALGEADTMACPGAGPLYPDKARCQCSELAER